MQLKKYFHHIKFSVTTFVDKELTLYAASLSFYTIFTIIPLLLILFTSITQLPSFEVYYVQIKDFILSNLMPIHSEQVMIYIDDFLKNSIKVGTIGFLMIFVSSILFFQNFEYIVNMIFKVKQRNFLHSLGTYIVLLILTPISLSLSFYLTGYIANIIQSNEITSSIKILPFLPYFIIWGFFFVIFKITANIKVNIKAAVISSFITAIVFNISKNIFIYYVIFNKSYATIYGSFSILIFLFLWIYVSWLIFIYGVKVCYLINRIYNKREKLSENTNK